MTYISSDDIKESIDYFKELSIDDDVILFIFLLTMQQGISTESSITFLTSRLEEAQTNDMLVSLWKLGGLFGPDEVIERHSIMFPNGFHSTNYYNKGTDFNRLIGRIKDTIEKKNTNNGIFQNNNSNLTLSRDYREKISNNYLNNNKISLKHLSCWIFRFEKFEIDNKPTKVQFTRVVKKLLYNFLRISKRDLEWIFEDDFDTSLIDSADQFMNPQDIREYIGKEVSETVLASNANVTQKDNRVISHQITNNRLIQEYLEINGDNPSLQKLKNVLATSKQIIFTGVPGTGKSRVANELSEDFDEVLTIQFHANTTYEDFVGGGQN